MVIQNCTHGIYVIIYIYHISQISLSRPNHYKCNVTYFFLIDKKLSDMKSQEKKKAEKKSRKCRTRKAGGNLVGVTMQTTGDTQPVHVQKMSAYIHWSNKKLTNLTKPDESHQKMLPESHWAFIILSHSYLYPTTFREKDEHVSGGGL